MSTSLKLVIVNFCGRKMCVNVRDLFVYVLCCGGQKMLHKLLSTYRRLPWDSEVPKETHQLSELSEHLVRLVVLWWRCFYSYLHSQWKYSGCWTIIQQHLLLQSNIQKYTVTLNIQSISPSPFSERASLLSLSLSLSPSFSTPNTHKTDINTKIKSPREIRNSLCHHRWLKLCLTS